MKLEDDLPFEEINEADGSFELSSPVSTKRLESDNLILSSLINSTMFLVLFHLFENLARDIEPRVYILDNEFS